MRRSLRNALLAAAALAAPRAATGAALVDYSRLSDYPAAPCGDAGVSRRLYEGAGLGVYLVRVRPNGQKAFLRFRGETVTVVPRDESYFSTKVVSTRPGEKHMMLERGDFFAHGAGEVTGGWYAGPKGDFDLLYLTYPEGFPEILGEEEGRRVVADRKPAPRSVHAIADSRAALGSAEGSARRVLFRQGATQVELVRVSAAMDVADPFAAAAALIAISGEPPSCERQRAPF